MLSKPLAVSGLPASGKNTLFKELCGVYRVNKISAGDEWRRRYCAERGLSLDNYDERDFATWWSNTTPEINIRFNEELKTMIESGIVIGDTRFMLHFDRSLVTCVFITADLDIRAQRAKDSGRYQTFEQARQTLQEREQREFERGREFFWHIDPTYDYRDPKHYDLVLDTGKLTVQQEVDQILRLVPPK